MMLRAATIFVFFFVLFLMLALANLALAACQVNGTVQDCTYHLSWDWAQDSGDPADGFNMQQQVDNNGTWYDILQPIPVTQLTVDDLIQNDKGGRSICYRVFAFNSAGRSVPVQ